MFSWLLVDKDWPVNVSIIAAVKVWLEIVVPFRISSYILLLGEDIDEWLRAATIVFEEIKRLQLDSFSEWVVFEAQVQGRLPPPLIHNSGWYNLRAVLQAESLVTHY